MSRKKRHIKSLTAEETQALKAGKKSKKGAQYNQRCHAILLSSQGYDAGELSAIFGVRKNAIYSWFDRYEEVGISGLENKGGRGRKALLQLDNKDHVEAVDKAVKKVNQKGGNLLAEVEASLDLEKGLTKRILRTFLKKLATYGSEVKES